MDIFYIRNGCINKKEAMIKMKVDDRTRELQLQMCTKEYEAEYIFKVFKSYSQNGNQFTIT